MRRLARLPLPAPPAARSLSMLDRLRSVLGPKEAKQAEAPSTPPPTPTPTPASADLPVGELTLDGYADQLRQARRLSGLAGMLPAGLRPAAAGAAGDASVAAGLQQQEEIVRALTAAEKAAPLGSLSAAARERIASQVGCTSGQVADALAKFAFTRDALARVQALKAAGKPLPTNFEELEAALGGGWRQRSGGEAQAASQIVPPEPAKRLMMHGRVVAATAAPKGGPSRNGPCACGSGKKSKRCCGK